MNVSSEDSNVERSRLGSKVNESMENIDVKFIEYICYEKYLPEKQSVYGLSYLCLGKTLTLHKENTDLYSYHFNINSLI